MSAVEPIVLQGVASDLTAHGLVNAVQCSEPMLADIKEMNLGVFTVWRLLTIHQVRLPRAVPLVYALYGGEMGITVDNTMGLGWSLRSTWHDRVGRLLRDVTVNNEGA